ncbi:hypothetical protein TNCV_1190621 [Trichonephila clavipes]|nr:hypothetical protein TNCV_1190621 [Trichonephila clavipes]
MAAQKLVSEPATNSSESNTEPKNQNSTPCSDIFLAIREFRNFFGKHSELITIKRQIPTQYSCIRWYCYLSQILSQTPSRSNTPARSGGSNLGCFHTPERRSTSISLHLHSTNHQPSHSYQRPGSDFSLGHSSILCGDYNAHHTDWGCISNNQRGLLLKNFTGDTETDILAPPTPTRFGYNSASTIDFALTRHFQRQLETDHLGDLIKRFHQKTGQSST